MDNNPCIAITMGDAAGIGPEIIVKSFISKDLNESTKFIVIGDLNVLKQTAESISLDVNFIAIDSIKDIQKASYNTVGVIHMDNLNERFSLGKVNTVTGNAAFEYIKTAVSLAKSKQVDGICTAPISKEALHLAGHKYPGHTEILADLTNTNNYSMMLSSPKLRVMHVTTHMGLITAIKSITTEKIFDVINLADTTLKKLGFSNPKIGVCGINPHAGENGLFGFNEEENIILPAIKNAQSKNIMVDGPLPADTLFYKAKKGHYDIVIAMYHDQGHCPLKVLGLEDGINITLGLPIIRTSVDHGTAFDIVGKGMADESSMVKALNHAAELALSEKSFV